MILPRQVKQYFHEKVAEFVFSEDPIQRMLDWLLAEFMKAESESKVSSEKNKHNKDRKTYFRGFRTRRFDTRLGTFYLLVPKLRNGGYIPFFLHEKKRSETALIALIQEAYVNGVSTRKVERLASDRPGFHHPGREFCVGFPIHFELYGMGIPFSRKSLCWETQGHQILS